MGFGANSYVGWVEESPWGTPVTPATKFSELVAEDLSGIRTRTPRLVIRNLDDALEGQLYDEKNGAEGGFTIEGNYGGLLRPFEHLFGDASAVTALVETAISWSHSFTLKDTLMSGKGLTLYLDTDTDAGSTPVKQVTGYKINSCRMSFDPKRNAQFQFSGAGKDFALVASQSPTFPGIANAIGGHQLTVEIDDVVRPVDTIELTVDNGMDLDKRVLGSKSIAEPVRGGAKRAVSGTIQMDALQADLTKFRARTLFKLTLVHLGPALGASNYLFTVVLPKCLIEADPYHVENFGVVKANFPFRALKPTSGERITASFVNDESAVA
jgi:hypothetical protein